MGRKRLAISFMGPVAVFLVVVGIAYACTPPKLYLSPNWTDAGQQVTVQGQDAKSGATVEVTLADESQATIATLFTATGPQFSQTVTLPADLADGEYWVMAHVEDSPTAGSTAARLRIGTEPSEGDAVPAPKPNVESKSGNNGSANPAPASSEPVSAATSATAPAAVQPAIAPSEPNAKKTSVEKGVAPAHLDVLGRSHQAIEAGAFSSGPAPSISLDTSLLDEGTPVGTSYVTYGLMLLVLAAAAVAGGVSLGVAARRRSEASRD